MFSKEVFAGRIKALRLEKGDTQGAFGEAIGLTKQTVNDIEHCKAVTSLEKLYETARYFGVSADYLLGLTDRRTPAEASQSCAASPGSTESV